MGSERDVRVSAVRVDDALDGMSVAGNRLSFFILDARRDNPFECSAWQKPSAGTCVRSFEHVDRVRDQARRRGA